MSDHPPAPRRRRAAWLQLAPGVAAVAVGIVVYMMHTGASGQQARVALEATAPTAEHSALTISDVTLHSGGDSVVLTSSTASVARAPALSDLGVFTVGSGSYTGVSARIGNTVMTARTAIRVSAGGVTPLVLVVRRDGIAAAAGNDDVNHAVLAAAGQLIHPPDVTFVDQTGRSVPLHNLRGRVLVVAALDAHCHDTCPLYTAIWADLQRVIRERGWQDRVAIAEVSMDPDRDTPEELAAYGHMVSATWPLLRSDPAGTLQFWNALGAAYVKAPPPQPPPVDWYTGKPEAYHLHHDSLAVVFDVSGDARYLLQGNPRLGHALSPALQALMQPMPGLGALQNAASWTLTDLLDRIDTVLGAPLEVDRSVDQAARLGHPAPDLALPGLDGRRRSLQAQLGRPVVVTFWATSCAPCRHDFPLLAAATHSHAGLLVLAVDEGESSGQVRSYLGDVLGPDAGAVTAVLDSDLSAASRYDVRGLPVNVFVGADGIVRAVRIGELQQDDLATALAATGA